MEKLNDADSEVDLVGKILLGCQKQDEATKTYYRRIMPWLDQLYLAEDIPSIVQREKMKIRDFKNGCTPAVRAFCDNRVGTRVLTELVAEVAEWEAHSKVFQDMREKRVAIARAGQIGREGRDRYNEPYGLNKPNFRRQDRFRQDNFQQQGFNQLRVPAAPNPPQQQQQLNAQPLQVERAKSVCKYCSLAEGKGHAIGCPDRNQGRALKVNMVAPTDWEPNDQDCQQIGRTAYYNEQRTALLRSKVEQQHIIQSRNDLRTTELLRAQGAPPLQERINHLLAQESDPEDEDGDQECAAAVIPTVRNDGQSLLDSLEGDPYDLDEEERSEVNAVAASYGYSSINTIVLAELQASGDEVLVPAYAFATTLKEQAGDQQINKLRVNNVRAGVISTVYFKCGLSVECQSAPDREDLVRRLVGSVRYLNLCCGKVVFKAMEDTGATLNLISGAHLAMLNNAGLIDIHKDAIGVFIPCCDFMGGQHSLTHIFDIEISCGKYGPVKVPFAYNKEIKTTILGIQGRRVLFGPNIEALDPELRPVWKQKVGVTTADTPTVLVPRSVIVPEKSKQPTNNESTLEKGKLPQPITTPVGMKFPRGQPLPQRSYVKPDGKLQFNKNPHPKVTPVTPYYDRSKQQPVDENARRAPAKDTMLSPKQVESQRSPATTNQQALFKRRDNRQGQGNGRDPANPRPSSPGAPQFRRPVQQQSAPKGLVKDVRLQQPTAKPSDKGQVSAVMGLGEANVRPPPCELEFGDDTVTSRLGVLASDELHMNMRGGICAIMSPVTIMPHGQVEVKLKVERDFGIKEDAALKELQELVELDQRTLVLTATSLHMVDMADGDRLRMDHALVEIDDQDEIVAILHNDGELPMTIAAGTELMKLEPNYMPITFVKLGEERRQMETIDPLGFIQITDGSSRT
jgi:hypothetical protein